MGPLGFPLAKHACASSAPKMHPCEIDLYLSHRAQCCIDRTGLRFQRRAAPWGSGDLLRERSRATIGHSKGKRNGVKFHGGRDETSGHFKAGATLLRHQRQRAQKIGTLTFLSMSIMSCVSGRY